MTRLEDIKQGMAITGVLPDGPVTVLGVAWRGTAAIELTYKDSHGRLGQERGHGDPERRGGRALPEGYRKALRVMRLAGRLGLPLLPLLETPGAYPGLSRKNAG